MSKELPILFSTEMVQAILDDRKFMTRRVIKPQPPSEFCHVEPFEGGFEFYDSNIDSDDVGVWPFSRKGMKCKYGQPGDILYVRENWAARDCDTSNGECKIEYQASPGEYRRMVLKKSVMILSTPLGEDKKWKPNIHLPKEASRIWLQVIDVSAERLHDITDDDAEAEGIRMERFSGGLGYKMYGVGSNDQMTQKPKISFQSLWESINGWESWEANPWVWAISFRVLSKTGKP